MIGESPKGMIDPHAHHICFKIGNGKNQKKLVNELQNLLVSYNINPILSKEVLCWAPNRGTKDQHSYKTLKALGDELKEMKELGGNRDDIIDILNRHKEVASSRKSTYKPKEKGKTTDRNGKCK
ncbi:hypothetical protein [Clostridium butyricum]|uniref:hypothetical protein n=1 Tax=Clostridium butyricum TaxID=1492 RepID=UPI00374EB302